MPIIVTRSRVKEKCSIEVATYDSTIDNLIAELTPVIEHLIREEHLADSSNSGLQSTLELAATEIVCGEFLEQLAREPGAMERLRLGDLELWPPDPAMWPAALSIKGSGWARLRPYMKSDPAGVFGTVAASSSSKSGPHPPE